jgi:hypothetical protein
MFGVDHHPVKAAARQRFGHQRTGDRVPQPDLLLAAFQRLFEAVDGQVHYTAPRRVAMRRRASR